MTFPTDDLNGQARTEVRTLQAEVAPDRYADAEIARLKRERDEARAALSLGEQMLSALARKNKELAEQEHERADALQRQLDEARAEVELQTNCAQRWFDLKLQADSHVRSTLDDLDEAQEALRVANEYVDEMKWRFAELDAELAKLKEPTFHGHPITDSIFNPKEENEGQ